MKEYKNPILAFFCEHPVYLRLSLGISQAYFKHVSIFYNKENPIDR